MGERPRILVIRHSALGDFVLSLGACKAIRDHHPEAEITLLTTAPFERLARASGLFDAVWLDSRPSLLCPPAALAMRRRLLEPRFSRIYDLQRSDRTGWYFRLLWPRPPEWVGTVAGCSHRCRLAADTSRHAIERETAQLALVGIDRLPPSDLSFVEADVSGFALPARFALLVPGGSAHRPEKRWPAGRYAELARALAAEGVTPVLIGSDAERAALTEIAEACPEAADLCGRTSLEQIVVLARAAELAVGNDTGPMHLIATAGCPALTLFSSASNPRSNAPRGPRVATLQRPDLAELPVAEVRQALEALFQG